jgi:uncharacterized protein YbjT (DUF2867 family)
MHAWVAGATGLVGQALVSQLLAHSRVGRVTALVRKSSGREHEKLHEREVNFDRLKAELLGAHSTHVFCCLGTTMAQAGSQEAFRRVDYEYPLAVAEIAAAAKAEAFLVVTAIGADPGSSTFYSRVKGELERDLAKLNLRGLRIFRPALLLGKRNERRTGEQLGIALARPLSAFMVGPLRKYRPIEAASVARAMVTVALNPPQEATTVYESDRIAEIAAKT